MSTIESTRRSAFASNNEAAAYLGVSRSTVYAEQDRKRLGYVMVAGCRRVAWAELDRYVQANGHPAEEE